MPSKARLCLFDLNVSSRHTILSGSSHELKETARKKAMTLSRRDTQARNLKVVRVLTINRISREDDG